MKKHQKNLINLSIHLTEQQLDGVKHCIEIGIVPSVSEFVRWAVTDLLCHFAVKQPQCPYCESLNVQITSKPSSTATHRCVDCGLDFDWKFFNQWLGKISHQHNLKEFIA